MFSIPIVYLATAGGAERIDFVFGFFFGFAVAFLDLAFELLGSAVDGVEVVVGELAPLLLDFAFDLFPVAFELVAVHFESPCVWVKNFRHVYVGGRAINDDEWIMKLISFFGYPDSVAQRPI